jgi:adenylate kinase
MKARGETLRPDDNPQVLKQRLAAYETQTAPLVDYYRGKGALRSVDGMASISDVASAIGRALADGAFRQAPARKPASGVKIAPRRAAKAKESPPRVKARKAAKSKPASKAASKPAKAGTKARKSAKGPQKRRKALSGRRLTK